MSTNKILKIEIENIKGFGQKTNSAGNKVPFAFDVDIFPNKPNIVVAPNGFGKSSLTAAFLSLKEKKMELEDDYIHDEKGTTANDCPFLKIYIDDASRSSYEANKSKNEISANFDVFVITSRLVPNSKKLTFGGFTRVSSFMDIKKSVLIQTIPQKEMFQYALKSEKQKFSKIGKALKDISFLFKKIDFLNKVLEDDLMEKFSGARVARLLDERLSLIKNYDGTTKQIKAKIISDDLPLLKANGKIEVLFNLVKEYKPDDWDDGDVVICMIQFLDVVNQMGLPKFKKALAYERYLQKKEADDLFLKSVNTTRFDIRSKEEKRSLVINWPNASKISNGQRDILSFASSLIEAENKLNADKNILVIDEIFDYLDDANLLTFQYRIAALIDAYKSQGKLLYPILFTHVDPAAFNHWSFGKKKIHVSYLKKTPIKHDNDLLTLVKERENAAISAQTDKHFFHYHPDSETKGNVNLSTAFTTLGISRSISDAFDFYEYISNECKKYIQGTSVNPIAVSFALRIQIEKKIYNQLNTDQKSGFIDEHGTDNKLDYAAEFLSKEIPEYYYLLGLIYNGVLHGKTEEIEQSIGLKLENHTIKKMINDVFE